MPEPSLNIALGSTFCRIGDIDFNLGQIGKFAEQAKRASADILLTPELSVTGYGPYPEVAALAETAGAGPIYQRLAEIAQASGVVIAAGFVEKHPHGPGISHYVVFPSGEFTVQRKFRVTPFEGPPLVSALPSLPLGGEPPEQLNFADLHFPTFKLKGVTCAVAICADSGIAGLQDFLDTLGVQVLFGPTGAGGNVNDRVRTSDLCTEEGRKKYLRALETAYSPSAQAVFDSIIHRRANVGVNQTGWDGRKCSHIGDSVIISPRGEILLMRGTFNLDFQKPAFRFGSIPLSHFE